MSTQHTDEGPSKFEYSTVRMEFDSAGSRCVGTLYRPDRPATPPVVVMANGFGADRTFGLPAYAERFAERGYAVFLFDYRHFGDSEGTPRRLVDFRKQVVDWQSAVAAVRRTNYLDTRRLVLWGFSLSGGHVLRVASEDRRIHAVIANVPMVDGKALVKSKGLRYNLAAVTAGVRDRLGSFVGRPHTIPIVGDPETLSALNESGARAGFMSLVPADAMWENELPARSLLSFPAYRPIEQLGDVTCPTLLVAGDRDAIIPADLVADAADELPDGTLVRLPANHYDLFQGETFEQTLAHQFAFLDSHR